MEKKPTILAVDDTEINIDILIGILKQFDVIPATSGEEALAIANEESIDLILLDILMPEMDGYEVCKALKDNPLTHNIPVIFITVKNSEDDIKKGFDLGSVDYVTKPFNPIELLARVSTHLELKNYRENLEQEVKSQLEGSRAKDKILFQHSKQAAIGELLIHIAHQWKQPLSELGAMNLSMYGKLKHGQAIDTPQLEESCQKTEQILKFMSETIETFQDFYKPISEKSFFDISQAISKAANIIDATYHFHKITLHINKSDSPKVYGNENEYAQVILNLLTNAKDAFIKNKIASPEVTIHIGEEEGKSIVLVNDNAGGIEAEMLEHLFYPFSGSGDGLGIGLHMSRSIMEKHGGSLEARNHENGALFTIRL